MYSDVGGILRTLAAGASTSTADSYVVLAERLYLTGDGAKHYSEAVSMDGYNGVFVECTVFAFSGFTDPTLNIYVQVSNDRQNWSTLPLGSAPVGLNPTTTGYSKLDQGTIGQQISAAWVRLLYETTGDIKVICSIGLDRKRLSM